MNIRKSLREARNISEFTQAEVAKYLDMTTNAYQAIEYGTRGTSGKNWLKLYHLFNEKTPLNKLMENTKERSLNFGEENDFSKNINRNKHTTGGSGK